MSDIAMPSSPIERTSAWTGEHMAKRPDLWLHELTGAEIADLERAARHFLSLGQDIAEISRDRFPLEHFDGHLRDLKQVLLDGVGVQVLRGLKVETYSRAMAATIFCGIGAHLGSARSQNAKGHTLGHVRDVGADPNDPKSRIYQTSARQTFHTDSADAVGLLCLKEAKEGGDSLLVSAETVFNRFREERPDLLPLLFGPIATDRRGEVPEGEQDWMEIPVLSWHAERLTVFYQRQYIDSSQRFEDAPRLTEAHVEALDLFDRLANDPQLHLTMRLQPGDMQFVYNHSQLHDRTGFLDWPNPDERRHLLRLWLSLEGDRPLPDIFRQRYGSIEIGDRGGIVVPGTRLHAPLD